MILGRRLKMSMLKKRCFLFCLIVLVIGNIWFLNLKNDNSNLIGAYIDGEYASNIPSKDAGYVVEKIVCDNEAVGEWNYDDWGLLVKNMTKKSKCNVYFRKGIKLADTITLVDATGKCPTVNDDGSVNVTSAESENSLLCMAPDNYGTSYYFRGNVQNNYVYFANLYWRIIRVNGDGSIRMIYDGTTAHENGEASADRKIGDSAFNDKDDDNAYVGYMYGTAGSSSYEETHANINDSTIKKYIDNWYESVFEENFRKYIFDSSFCNYRKLMTGLGYGKNKGVYIGYWNIKTLLCQKNDILTVNDNINGSAVLRYPIGMLTRTEALLAGGYRTDNKNYYLYNGNAVWLQTPVDAFNDVARARNADLTDSGNPYGTGCSTVTCNLGVKPVINLKPNSLKLGDGTISNAYRVS